MLCALLAIGWLGSASRASAQTLPVLAREVVSRESTIDVGGIQTPELQVLVSAEFTVFVGGESEASPLQTTGRELTVVVGTPSVPRAVGQMTVEITGSGDAAKLSWLGYNEWAESDLVRYDVYVSDRRFTNLVGLVPISQVRAETQSLALSGLAPGVDRFFAVVPVDSLGQFDPNVTPVSAYWTARETFSRELAVFCGGEPGEQPLQALSRDISLVVATSSPPSPIDSLQVAASPTGESATLSWERYNEWSELDVAHYQVYLAEIPFTNVTSMVPFTTVAAETRTVLLDGLATGRDRYFAVVAVDAAGGLNPSVRPTVAYSTIAQLATREYTVFVGGDGANLQPNRLSREMTVVVATPAAPAPVSCAGCAFSAQGSISHFAAVDLDWSSYDEPGQADVTRYRVYLGTTYYDTVAGWEPYRFVPAETKRLILTGLDPLAIYYVAIVAEDAQGNYDPRVRARSTQASPERIGEVSELVVDCGVDALTIHWSPPLNADPRTNALLAGYRMYVGGQFQAVALGPMTRTHTVTHLVPGHGYPVRLTTIDILDRESEGAMVLAATKLPNPGLLVVQRFDGSPRLSWERVEPEELVGDFALYVSTEPMINVVGMQPALTTRAHSADIGGLVGPDRTYFTVVTRNLLGCDSTDLPIRIVSTRQGAPDAPVLRLLAPTGGNVRLDLDGVPGMEFVIEESVDLREWFPVLTNRPNVLPSTVDLTRSPQAPPAAGFYRVLAH